MIWSFIKLLFFPPVLFYDVDVSSGIWVLWCLIPIGTPQILNKAEKWFSRTSPPACDHLRRDCSPCFLMRNCKWVYSEQEHCLQGKLHGSALVLLLGSVALGRKPPCLWVPHFSGCSWGSVSCLLAPACPLWSAALGSAAGIGTSYSWEWVIQRAGSLL